MKAKLLGAVVILILVGLGLFGWVGYQLFTTGFSAKTEPHALEVLMARQIRHLAIPIEKRNAANPVPLNADIVKEGRTHFADHCAVCHSNDGSGQTPIGKNVYPKAPDLRLTVHSPCRTANCSGSSTTGSDLRPCLPGEAATRRRISTAGSWCILSVICRGSHRKNWTK